MVFMESTPVVQAADLLQWSRKRGGPELLPFLGAPIMGRLIAPDYAEIMQLVLAPNGTMDCWIPRPWQREADWPRGLVLRRVMKITREPGPKPRGSI
jgi:hypothetical protein